jgi:hypothetical protein
MLNKEYPLMVISVDEGPAPLTVIPFVTDTFPDHVQDPAGIETVSPGCAEFTAAWTADCEQLDADIVAPITLDPGISK